MSAPLLLLALLDWGLWILVWESEFEVELEDENGGYSGVQLFQLHPDTALALLLGTAQSVGFIPLEKSLIVTFS